MCVVFAEKVPDTDDENDASVVPVMCAGGVTPANASDIAVGVPKSGMTSEVNDSDCGGCAALRVRDVPPFKPKTASLNDPDRKFVPPPPARLVIVKVPLNAWITCPATNNALLVLVAFRVRKALNGTPSAASIPVTVIMTSVPVMVVDVPAPFAVPVIVAAPPTWPNDKITPAVAGTATSRAEAAIARADANCLNLFMSAFLEIQ